MSAVEYTVMAMTKVMSWAMIITCYGVSSTWVAGSNQKEPGLIPGPRASRCILVSHV